MRIANLAGRLALLTDDGVVDVEQASKGLFDADPQAVYDRWDEFREWGQSAAGMPGQSIQQHLLESPAPRPRQLLAVGLNYRAHTEEASVEAPDAPAVFAKFPTSIAGAMTEVALPEGTVDWEAELVVVVGRHASHIDESEAWSYVAGLTVGQDLSERTLQFSGPAPQWGLAKSFPGFSPFGPSLVSPDELDDPDDLAIEATLNGEVVQSSRTSKMIFAVPALLSWLTAVIPLLPGDVIYTGTPGGVGMARNPARFLAPGDELITSIEGIGSIRQRFIAKPPTAPRQI